MYTTKKIISLEPTDSIGTLAARNALVYGLPYIGTAIVVFLATLIRLPLFGAAVALLAMLYAPLLLLNRPVNVNIDRNTCKVVWKPVRTIDRHLLKQNLYTCIFFVIASTLFLVVKG